MATDAAPERYDALVVGSGAGGLSAAARLAHHGYRVLLVESRDRVGGRASSVDEEGFTVNVGGIAVEYGGVLEETFREVGAPWDVRVPKPATLFRLKGKDVDLSKGGLGKLVNGITKKGAGLLGDMGKAGKNAFDDGEGLTLEAWLSKYTKNDTLHAIFRNLAAAIFAVNSSEVSAKAFLTYLTQKGAFRDFGFSPTGTGGLFKGLADVVEARGGTVWTDTAVRALHVENGRVTGATIAREGGDVEVECEVVVSNAGPHATVALAGREHFGDEYLALIERDVLPTANIVFNIASAEPLMEAPGIITFGVSRSLCNMANLTATCPELAPDGQHLYVAYGVPTPAVGAFDEAANIEATHQDLRDEFPGFDDRARILSVRVMKGEFPAQRTIAGRDVDPGTPIENLWNVGDAVREYADGGMQACAKTGKVVVERILALHGETPARAGAAAD